jgi:mannose/fructose/N-acetylgalactosamine-specific phosphotransferase system component IID
MSHAADRKIPDIVKSKLTGLRLKVGAWLIANAMARIIPTILGLLAFIFVVDWFLEMDVPQRIIMAVLAVAAILVVVYFKMFRPFSQRLSDEMA